MPAYLPLLHVAETVVRVTVLDGRFLAAGALMLALAIALIWSPRRGDHISLRRRDARAAGRAAIVVLVFLAVLPSVVPYDHLLVPANAGHEDVHATHCHGAPGECADAPIPAGPGQMFGSVPLIAVPAMLSLLLLIAVVPLVGTTRRPELRPPLRVASI
ncbi:MAG: hypothetical protein WEB52_13715 [Dehalococcoidia bacterium]